MSDPKELSQSEKTIVESIAISKIEESKEFENHFLNLYSDLNQRYNLEFEHKSQIDKIELLESFINEINYNLSKVNSLNHKPIEFDKCSEKLLSLRKTFETILTKIYLDSSKREPKKRGRKPTEIKKLVDVINKEQIFIDDLKSEFKNDIQQEIKGGKYETIKMLVFYLRYKHYLTEKKYPQKAFSQSVWNEFVKPENISPSFNNMVNEIIARPDHSNTSDPVFEDIEKRVEKMKNQKPEHFNN